jgi:hypothetical protein
MRRTSEILPWDSERLGAGPSTKKIGDVPHPCSHPEHNPPSHMVYKPGVYEHTCPGYGKKTVFTVPGVYC